MSRPGILRTATLLLLLTWPRVAPAEETFPDNAQAALDLLARYREAVLSCRIDELADYWADDSTIFISSGDPLISSEEYFSRWTEVCTAGGEMTFGPVSEALTMLSADAALVTGTMFYVFTPAGGDAHSGTTRTTTVLRRMDGEWKLLHAHGSELGDHGGVED